MASEPEGPAMETLPTEEKLEEIDMIGPAETQQASDQPSDAAQQHESLSQRSHKSPPKNGIPPRRHSTATKRAVASTSAPTSRSNALSSSRNVPGSGLSKPPTRPLASSSARRPTSNFAATTTASSGHKKSSSIDSVDKLYKSGSGVSDENSKPVGNKPETKRHGYGREESRFPKENSLPDKVKQSGTSGVLQSTGSPSKSASKSNINSRLSGGGITPRNARPAVSSSRRGVVGNEAPRKRLSTIPASPAPTQSDSTASASATQPTPSTRAIRPALNSRKSTMSVTIEQRLREMELVHQMIHVAMAEDGDESDEVKEEYGRKVDESLASLRTKLEEARRNEGIADRQADTQSGNQPSENLHPAQSPNETALPTVDVVELQGAFDESQAKISFLTKEVSKLQDDLHRIQLVEKDAQILATERGVTIDRIKKMHEDAEQTTQKLQDQHNSKVKKLLSQHEKELLDARNTLDEAESRYQEELANSIKGLEEAKSLAVSESSKEVADSLGSQIDAHKLKFQALERELQDEKDRGLNAASRLHDLQSEVSNLQSLLSEASAERQKLQDTRRSLNEEQLSTIKERDHDILDLKAEIETLRSLQGSELEEVKSNSSAEKRALESEIVNLRRSIQESDKSHHSAFTAHQDELSLKAQEIHGLGLVVEDFQEKIQELHEMKEREINETKHDLIQAHERAISDFRRKHQEELAEATTKRYQESEALREEHQNVIDSTKAAHLKDIEDIQKLLDESRSSLEEASLAKEEVFASVDLLNKRISTLVAEKDEAQKANLSTEATLKLASTEVTTLKNSFETLSIESRDKEERHFTTIQKLKDELDSKAELYATNLEAQETKGQSSLRDLQDKYDALLATWNQSEREYPAAMEKLKEDHEDAIRNHAQILEDLKTLHAKETEANANQASLSHQEDVEKLKDNHEKEFSTFSMDLQEKERAKSSSLQEAHDAVLSDVKSQLQKQTEALVHMEEELRIYRDKECSEAHSSKGDDLNHQLSELKTQLSNSQADVAEAKDEITRLIVATKEAEKVLPDTAEADGLRNEISELITRHSAEISKVHEHAAHENERREKERKQGAEIRDRLASESERMRNDLLVAQANAEEHQRALDLSTKKLQDANKSRAAAHEAAERHKNEHQITMAELKAVRAEFEQLKVAKSRSKVEISDAYKQDLEALQIAADRERLLNAKLKKQVHEMELASERQATKLREVECALKVTTAELVEAQTSRPNGSEYAASPAPKSGLRSSRWGVAPELDQNGIGSTPLGEELGSLIEGNMAGIQEQIRQLEEINNDILEDEHRVMKMLSKASESAAKQTSEGSPNKTSGLVSRGSFDGAPPQPTPFKSQDEALRSASYNSLGEEEL